MLVNIDTLLDHSIVWIFPANRRLTEAEAQALQPILDHYVSGWKAHEVPVHGSWELRYNQFLIIAANPDVTAPSGCSIDDLTRAIKTLNAKFGVDFFSPMKIFYREVEDIKAVRRSEFKALAQHGEVGPETIVFDNSLKSLGALRGGNWEVPASRSWHAALLAETVAV